MRPQLHDLKRDDAPETRSAVRFCVAVTVAGVGFLIVAALLTSGCDPSALTAACGRPARVTLALGAPVILFCGGVRAFVRTYQLWKSRGQWWAWQGAGWFLMLVMLLVLTMSLPAVGGFNR